MRNSRNLLARAAALVLAFACLPAWATTWTVTTNAEAAALGTNTDCPSATACTFRSAINQAAISGDSIVFDKAVMDGVTITLTLYTNCLSTADTSATCLPLATWPGYVSQFGPSAFFISGKTLTIDATANGLTKGVVIARSSVGGTPNFRLFDVDTGSSLTLRGLTLSNGYAKGGDGDNGGGALGAGGAIFNQGSVILDRCTLTGNTAFGGNAGAVILSHLGGSGVGQNAPNTTDGGGPNGGGTSSNGGFGGGGGIGANGGFGGGGAYGGSGFGTGGTGGFGGGASGYFFGGGPGFGGGAGSGAGNGIYGGGGAGMGGAIFNDAGSVSLANVTISGNAANGGAGSAFGGQGPGSGLGGALFNYGGSMTLEFVTLSGNSVSSGNANGMNIYSLGDSAAACSAGGNPCLAPGAGSPSGAATLTLDHSIAANGSGATNDVVVNAINSGTSSGSGVYDAIGAATGFTASNPVTGTLSLGALPATLRGGRADVLIPKGASVAIDATPCDATATDQRGIARPQGAACDIGAVEVTGLCFVWASATSGSNDGSSWANAYTDLQSALGDLSCKTVWVAKGVYKPTSGADQTISFNVHPGVAVHGGFAGTETLLTERTNIAGNPTVMSGDIDSNDSVDANGVDQTVDAVHNSGNSHTVVMMDGTTAAGGVDADTLLDGFILTAGNNAGGNGSGLYCNGSGSGHRCNPTLSNVTFSGNSAQNGGAMYNSGGDYDGSGGGTSSPVLNNVTFSGNSAQNGGAMYNDGGDHSGGGGGGTSSPMLSKVTFSSNSASNDGGAMYNLGGFGGGTSSPGLSNVTFSGNSADNNGGAMVNSGFGGTSNPTLSNVTFSGNTATTAGSSCGGALYDFFSFPILKNVIVWGNTSAGNTSANAEICNANSGPPNTGTPKFTNSVVQGSGGSSGWDPNWGTDNGGNIDADPKLGPLQNTGGSTPTLLPGAGSSAIDHGDAATCSAAPVGGLDQRGFARPQGPACDIGAVEVKEYKLTTNVTTANGSVSTTSPLNSTNISACTHAGGANCSASYSAETAPAQVVTLAATPASGYRLSAWGGACASDGTVTMSADKTCTAAFAKNTISGSIAGLAGSGLKLHLDYGTGMEDLGVANPSTVFAFTSAVPSGATYAITVGTPPSNLSQTCTVTNPNPNNQMPAGNVGNISVTCTTNKYTVGGNVSGLSGSGLKLQLNAANATAFGNGSFTFGTPSEAIASGKPYSVSVSQQPSDQICTTANASGTVTNANIANVAVHCAPQFSLSVDDGHLYARYGHVVDYTVTLTNNGSIAATNVSLSNTATAGLDLPNALWCQGPACTPSTQGPLNTTADPPAHGSVTWLISVPVLANASAPTVTLSLSTAGNASGSDTDTLVIFRDSFDVANGGGVASLTPKGTASEVFVLPATSGNAVTDVYRSQHDNVRVQSLSIANQILVRLLVCDGAQERASAWTRAQAGATLALGSVAGTNDQHIVLLEGAEQSILLSIAE